MYDHLMERVVERDNMLTAYSRVQANKGAHGVDGMTLDEFGHFLKHEWPAVKEQLLTDAYHPKKVRTVTIPKQSGGTRTLGIPTVLDRLIQQALLQVLTPIFDPTFSEHSYGFRPNRSAHDAIVQASAYVKEGYAITVDMDIAKFFDNVRHDALMAKIAKTVTDKRVLRLIRRFLEKGGSHQGRIPVGTPQGGPLSPLLANIVLDELDKELERRGHRFVRYADDCNIFVKSPRAGERVLDGIEQFLHKKLSLTVNRSKTAVDRPIRRSFLGFTIDSRGTIRLPKKTKDTIRQKIRNMTKRRYTNTATKDRMNAINTVMRGWFHYFKPGLSPSVAQDLDGYIRRRIRMCEWTKWKRVRTRMRKLRGLGVKKQRAYEYANTRKGYWRVAGSFILTTTLTNEWFAENGYQSLTSLLKAMEG